MALRSYGYGRWDAPYWFIGPEQGQGDGSLECRLKAWTELGAGELCDCRQFHRRIEEQKWHRDHKPPLQRTWDKLIILLKAFKGEPSDSKTRQTYQRDELGMLDGETCVIELSGLAAHNLKVDRGSFRTEYRPRRIETIRNRIRENVPKFVVMYGTTDKAAWQEIAGCGLEPGKIAICSGIAFVMAEHPVSRQGVSNGYWQYLGNKLRERVTHY